MRVAAVSAVVASASGFMPSAPSLAPSWSWTQRAACIASALRSACTHQWAPRRAWSCICAALPRTLPGTRPLPCLTRVPCRILRSVRAAGAPAIAQLHMASSLQSSRRAVLGSAAVLAGNILLGQVFLRWRSALVCPARTYTQTDALVRAGAASHSSRATPRCRRRGGVRWRRLLLARAA